ncbi:AIPR family protein [Arthrobacter sp. LS16]|uniref:AIPR family protein n=1 Tax=Arthrobacter sp. 'calajunan' TaxID=1690248 RepID=UPI003C78BE20
MTLSPDQIIAKEAFNKFRTENYPSLSEAHAFERFSADLELRHHGVTGSDLEQGLVATKNDGGIDGFYILLNKTELLTPDSIRISRKAKALDGIQHGLTVDVYLIQAKNETKWDTNVFTKIRSTLEAIFDDKVTEKSLREFPLNDNVVEMAKTWRAARRKLAEFAPVYNFHVLYVSFGEQRRVENYMKTKSKQLKDWLSSRLPTGSRVTVDHVGDVEIVKRVRKTVESKAMLKLAKHPMRDGKSLVGLISIKEYIKFLRQPKSKIIRDELFATNVRDYAGSNIRVNNAIAGTLSQNSSSNFWWLNNGITIIADKMNDPVEFEWLLVNPLIVNGLQTSHVIHEQELSGNITSSRLNQLVLVRVISESDPEVRESVINATNNQTAIAGLQLHANDEKQIRIEEYLKAHDWYYERRRHQYRGRAISAAKIRTPTDLAQAVMAYRLALPDTARARPNTLLSKASGWDKIFADSIPEIIYLKALETTKAVAAYLQTDDAAKISDDITNVRYYLVFAYALYSSGVTKIVDFESVPDNALKSAPNSADLAKLHQIIIDEVTKLANKGLAADRIYKGSELKGLVSQRVLLENSKNASGGTA